jgi:hypothetical protein
MGYTHGRRWTDNDIKIAVLNVIESERLDRMPSRKECANFYGNGALVSAVSKRPGGWYGLAKELGYSIKKSDTYLGKTQEGLVCNTLLSMGFDVERMSQNFPYDILVDNCVKVDVKASRLYHGKNGNFFTFNLEKKYATCDIYILATLNDEGDIIDSFIVPSKFVINNSQISIGEKSSKYMVFRNRWDYITKFSTFFRSVI